MNKVSQFEEAEKIKTLQDAIDTIKHNRSVIVPDSVVLKRIIYIFDTYIAKGLGSKTNLDYQKKERNYHFGMDIFVVTFNKNYKLDNIELLVL
jgi:hypothetical protein